MGRALDHGLPALDVQAHLLIVNPDNFGDSLLAGFGRIPLLAIVAALAGKRLEIGFLGKPQALSHGLLGQALHRGVEGGDDSESARIEICRRVHSGRLGGLLKPGVRQERGAQIAHVVRGAIFADAAGFAVAGLGGFGNDRLGDGLLIVLFADKAAVEHGAQHGVAPFERVFLAVNRIVDAWPLGNAGQQGALRQRQFFHRPLKIHVGGRFDSVGVAAEENLVQVELEDLLLGIAVFDLQGGERFLDFAVVGALGAVDVLEDAAGQLHGNGAGAFLDPAGAVVGQGGAHDADGIDAEMIEEALVLDRQEGFDQGFGNVFVAQQIAALLPEFGQRVLAFGVVDERRFGRRVVFQFFVGRLHVDVADESAKDGGAASGDREEEQQKNQVEPEKAPAALFAFHGFWPSPVNRGVHRSRLKM
ncbi:MAG: hypothetical protein BWZ10_02152 [candidate division BRC1 bacterium ADurb.BinA364]|nr:MAG: hypothetical protein BWZ10_02152 [candidate division BRC1 bacterium ADurb.BinA364]